MDIGNLKRYSLLAYWDISNLYKDKHLLKMTRTPPSMDDKKQSALSCRKPANCQRSSLKEEALQLENDSLIKDPADSEWNTT
jgi:hypothetical protein